MAGVAEYINNHVQHQLDLAREFLGLKGRDSHPSLPGIKSESKPTLLETEKKQGAGFGQADIGDD